MRKHKALVHNWRYYTKQQCKDWTPAIKVTILNHLKEMTVEEIAIKLVSGHPVIFGHLKPDEDDEVLLKQNRKVAAASRHWVSQSLFALDIDNQLYDPRKPETKKYYLTIDDAIKLCEEKGFIPAFIYTTYSHEEHHHKFRVVFQMTQEIKTVAKRNKVMDSLFEIFTVDGHCLADLACKDPARLFYPGKKLVYTNYQSTIIPDSLTRKLKPTFTMTDEYESYSVIKPKVKKDTHPLVRAMRLKEYDRAIKMIADSVKQHSTPWETWTRGLETKTDKESYIYITKCFFYRFSQYPSKPMVSRDPEFFYQVAHMLPFHLLFGFESYKNIRCMLPGHEDEHASARFEKKPDEEFYYYKCYGCMKKQAPYDIFTFLEKINGWSHREAQEFVGRLLNIKYETEFQKQKKLEILDYIHYLMSDQFKERFPFLYKELRRKNVLYMLELLLLEASRLVLDIEITQRDEAIFYYGVDKTAKMMKERGLRGSSRGRVQDKLKLITKLQLLEILPDEELPQSCLEWAKTSQMAKSHQKRRLNYYRVPKFTTDIFVRAQEIMQEVDNLNIRQSHYSSQMEIMAFGKESAKKQFVQTKNLELTDEVKKFYERYKEVALELIEKQGYTTEKEIISHRRIRLNKRKKELSATVMPKLLIEYDLQVVRYNKYYKELFEIKQGRLNFGTSKIIVKSKDVPKDKK